MYSVKESINFHFIMQPWAVEMNHLEPHECIFQNVKLFL